jgi:type II secretory pathway predicted ATPase ExeA
MSESFFGLRKRPFAALPDVDAFVPLNGFCQAFDELMQTTTEGRGIGVLTAPAGLGKTLVCQRLARELSGQFRVALIPSGNFLTRRSLLQAILFELGHSFVRMSDQELRLALSTTLQAIRPSRRGLVMIVDEAHLLATRMLEELRALLNQGEGGEPLVRLIVSGQLSLEETLSRPQCDAFNQRIGCQSMLPSLTRDESSSYLTRRLAWAGANVSEVFTRDALIAICEAADGVPRCLHQLADHCLMTAASRTEKPINVRTVHETLEHLKQLPLTWAEPTTGRRTTNALEAARSQAGSLPNSIEFDGPMARLPIDSGVADRANREPLDQMLSETLPDNTVLNDAVANNTVLSDTYPLQVDLTEMAADSEPQPNSWELDSHSVLASPWNDDDVDPRMEQPVTTREPYTGIADDDLQLIDEPQTTSTLIGANIEYGAAMESLPVIETEAIGPVVSDRRQTVLPEIEMPQPAAAQVESPQLAAMTTGVDEEVVIDRYAALDSALNRLTRTMLNARTNVRRKAAEAVVPPQPIPVVAESIPLADMAVESIAVESLDAVHGRFDIVLPEDDTVSRSTDAIESVREPKEAAALAVAAAVAHSIAAPAAANRDMANNAAKNERRPYQLLFSELRRRRRRV